MSYACLLFYNIMNIQIVIRRTIVFIFLSALMAAVISAILIMRRDEIFLTGKVSPFLLAGVIVILFIIFSTQLISGAERIFSTNRHNLEQVFSNLIIDINYLRKTEDIITRTSDIIYSALGLKNVFALLLNPGRRRYEFFYSKLDADKININPINMDSAVIKWFSQNNEVLDLTRLNKDKEELNEVFAEIKNIFNSLNIKIIVPLFNNKQVIALLYLTEKSNSSSLNKKEIRILQKYIKESSPYITNAADYEEWRRGQLVSGLFDLSSEILSKAMPTHLPRIAGIDFGAFYMPQYSEGVDYFDFINPANNGVGVIATDIPGRGINNSIYSVILRSSLHSCIEDHHSTFVTVQKLNNTLYEYTKGKGRPVKAFYYYYNTNTMRLTYTNAGFQPMEIFRVEKNFFESLDTEGAMLGAGLNANFGMGRTNLLVGDIGLLYTAALIESKNPKGENFGLTQLRRIVKENRRKSPAEITSIIREEFMSFTGDPKPVSNILVIIFKV